MADWLEVEIARGPTNAAHAFGLFKAFIRWCDTHETYAGIVSHDAYASPKVKGILPRSIAKDDCLQREQLSVWFGSVRGIANLVISAYLRRPLDLRRMWHDKIEAWMLEQAQIKFEPLK